MIQLLVSALAAGAAVLEVADARKQETFKEGWQADFIHQTKAPAIDRRESPDDWDGRIPMHITNSCDDTIWPGITTQSGTGPGTGGFKQAPGNTTKLWVSPDWEGRIWGRTNCTVSGKSASCDTGDCMGELDCKFGVSRLAETETFVCTSRYVELTARLGRNAGDAGRIQSRRWDRRDPNLLRHLSC